MEVSITVSAAPIATTLLNDLIEKSLFVLAKHIKRYQPRHTSGKVWRLNKARDPYFEVQTRTLDEGAESTQLPCLEWFSAIVGDEGSIPFTRSIYNQTLTKKCK